MTPAATARPTAATRWPWRSAWRPSTRSKPELLANVNDDVAGYFTQQLNGLKDRFPDVIVDIRGKGLLIGIKLVPNNREFMVTARDQQLLIAGGGDNCVRLLPPLNLTQEEAREAIEKLERACEARAPRRRPPREPEAMTAPRHFIDLWKLDGATCAPSSTTPRPARPPARAGRRARSTPTRRPRTACWR
jgi:hypothetical protein